MVYMGSEARVLQGNAVTETRDDGAFDQVYWFNADKKYKINAALYSFGTKHTWTEQS